MRRLLACFLLLISIGLSAADFPQFSQHTNLQGLINPAYNGSRESYSALLVTRNQWGDAVSTHAMNAHAPLPIGGLGAGLVVMQDNIGLNSSLRAIAAMSYRLSISDKIMLAAGLQGGLVREQVGNPTTPNGNPSGDIAVGNFGKTTNRPSAGLGFYMYSSRFFAGLSLPEVLPNGLDDDGVLYNDLPLFLYGGILLPVSSDVQLKPTAFVQATYAAPVVMEVGLAALYKELFSFGVATRAYPFTSLVFALEIQAVDNLYIGYTYDLPIADAPDAMKKGTHEVSLRFDITAKNMFTKPSGSMRFF